MLLFSSFWRGEQQLYWLDLAKNQPADSTIKEGISVTRRFTEPVRAELFRASKPYRFSFSTDLFFPIVYFNSESGLLTYLYWQASDMLGNHQITTDLYCTESGRNLEYQIRYFYNRWRPQLTFVAVGNRGNFYSEERQIYYRERQEYAVEINYPLDRFHNLIPFFSTAFDRQQENELSVANVERKIGVWLVRNTTQSKYLTIPLSGELIQVGMQTEQPWFGTMHEVTNYLLYLKHFLPVWFTHNLQFTLQVASSSGKNRGVFNLPVRGWSLDYNELAAKHFYFNLAYQIPLSTQFNYHKWYILPDFFFKYCGVTTYFDCGTVCDSFQQLSIPHGVSWYKSIGIGLRFYAFIMQYLPLTIGIDWIKQIDTDFSRGELVFSVGYN